MYGASGLGAVCANAIPCTATPAATSAGAIHQIFAMRNTIRRTHSEVKRKPLFSLDTIDLCLLDPHRILSATAAAFPPMPQWSSAS